MTKNHKKSLALALGAALLLGLAPAKGRAGGAPVQTEHDFAFKLKLATQGSKETKDGEELTRVRSNFSDIDAAPICGGNSFRVRFQCGNLSPTPILLVTDSGESSVGTLTFDASFRADTTDKNGRLTGRVVSTTVTLACVFNVVTLNLLGSGTLEFMEVDGQDCPSWGKVVVHGATTVFQDGASTPSTAEKGNIEIRQGVVVGTPPP